MKPPYTFRNHIVGFWREFTVPATWSATNDLAIHQISVVPSPEHHAGGRPKGTLLFRVGGTTMLSAPVSMLMDAHVDWMKLVDKVNAGMKEGSEPEMKSSTLLLEKFFRLQAPILAARDSYMAIYIDPPFNPEETFTVCIKGLERVDVR